MTVLLRRTFFILFVLLAVLSVDALAQANPSATFPTGMEKKVSNKKTVKTRKRTRRRVARWTGWKTLWKATFRARLHTRTASRALTGKKTSGSIAVAMPKAMTISATAHLAGSTPTVTTKQMQYVFVGYTATDDGAPARMWRSREYTVHSPYAYLGRMKFGESWEHVWVETTGNLLASAVTEAPSEPLPDIARMLERFPDGGLGVVVARWDEFAPPAEPAVEVVEFGDHQPGITH